MLSGTLPLIMTLHKSVKVSFSLSPAAPEPLLVRLIRCPGRRPSGPDPELVEKVPSAFMTCSVVAWNGGVNSSGGGGSARTAGAGGCLSCRAAVTSAE